MQRFRILLPVCASLIAIPLSASADETGDAGIVDELQVNGDNSDQHAAQHGSLKIRYAKNKTQEYLWGGARCSNFTLDDNEVELLVGAFHTRPRTKVVPYYKNGTNGARCIVAFELRRPKSEPDEPE